MRLGVRLIRLAAPLAAAGLLAGCFQPLYGEHTIGGGPSIKAALGSVDIAQIPAPNGTPESRIAVDVRNNLLFALNASSKPIAPAYRLNIRMSSTRLTVIVDLTSARPELENYGLNVSYDLVDAKTGKVVISDVTFARVSYDIPGQAQRFAQARGLRDAENRAGQVIVEHIKNRLASYFVAGT
ncbi:MAG TPA: LPS assembly lipoprotein LptE [Xanthobacteraceae bacterium]|jgi:LPS-assembly lipoprotein|nr:LPS assembly lipoprotein LptE [Xanthobacteraceae bacterium]